MKKKIAIIMGSSSDSGIMSQAAELLKLLNVPYEFQVVSAHRSPEWMFEYAKAIPGKGIAVVIAGAGGAAHLPGMMAALCTVPVIGVPINSSNSIAGIDSLLSIAQMPNDVPVATVAINGAHNAAILAIQILAVSDPGLQTVLEKRKAENRQKVITQNATLNY